MADILPAAESAFLHDIHTVQESVQAGTTQYAQHQKIYKKWSDFCSNLLINPAFQDPSIPHIEVLLVYRHCVRHAHYSNSQVAQLGKESVSQAWGAVVTAQVLDGLPDTRKPPNSHAKIGLDK